MANVNAKPLPVSELPAITAAQISNDDLLLVTDIDGGSKTSKKMTMAQLVQYVCNQISKNPKLVDTHIENIAEEVFDSKIDDGVVDAVLDRNQTVLDSLDGQLNGQLILKDDK